MSVTRLATFSDPGAVKSSKLATQSVHDRHCWKDAAVPQAGISLRHQNLGGSLSTLFQIRARDCACLRRRESHWCMVPTAVQHGRMTSVALLNHPNCPNHSSILPHTTRESPPGRSSRPLFPPLQLLVRPASAGLSSYLLPVNSRSVRHGF